MQIDFIILCIICWCVLNVIGGISHQQNCSYCEGLCLRCMPGYYGKHCDISCSSCKQCDRQSGMCNSNGGNFNEPHDWAYNCTHCTGNCRSCLPGWYGQNCTLKCLNCDVDGCNKVNGSCYKCSPGFTGKNCTELCPENCGSSFGSKPVCDQFSQECLDGCKKGWWGNHCREKCSEGCLHSECSYDGTLCIHGCKTGYTGVKCIRTNCNENCSECDKQNNCLKCKDKMYGVDCSLRCNEGCVGGDCQRDGSCECRHGYFGTDCGSKNKIAEDSCRPGWFGPKCQLECNNCNNNGCEKQSGICHECREGYFGYYCSDRCSENCILNYDNISKSSCSRDSGQCLHGCVKGWFGDRCETKCSKNCIKQLCENDGTCLEGCYSGWTGRRCLQNSPKLEGGYATKLELIFAFITPVLIFIVFLAAYVIHKKMKNAAHKEPNLAPESVSLSDNTSTVTDHYDQINESQLESFSDISSNNSQQIPLCFNNDNNNQMYLHPIVEDVFIVEVL